MRLLKKILFTYPLIGLLLILQGCQNNQSVSHKNAPEEPVEEPNTVHFTAAQIKSIGLETGFIEQKELTNFVRANGSLRVPNQNKALINSLYSGVVRSLLIQPGNTVKKGQLIATIANPDFIRVQEEYLSITPRIILAEQELNRQKELSEGNAGALKNLQKAAADLNALTTSKLALAQQIQLMGITPSSLSNGKLIAVVSIRSPIQGVVSSVSVKMGSYVDLNTPVAEIVDNSQLHLDLFVYEKDLPKIRNNQPIHFTLTNNPGKEYDAEIFSLGSSFEDESKAISVHARVKGEKTGLIDGMSITALISLDKVATPAVPNDAIVNSQGQDFIFIVSDEPGQTEKEMRFQKIPVAKGVSEVGYTQITLLKPVAPESRIVTKGAFFVLAKMNSSEEDGHGH
ncbi:efflux RND transporter periplasmic adaptor subunit [Flavihumibacter sp. CACIAM 22H1]|uniref:efflux RND transporter periplasmic adaptor subunit n=1 Tax=Flavihumibacter sp. CACIAM 22H1 TaxID=1812911 RepID=UPI0007A7E306|nr:efflux RND transporter periplasmic adaptor subunit [Flavihumibacter sp. CACIAM 22H1]KYP13632.1 MAG: efflux transporter periplasmic adaptor subunit [Flavihumibacter sp. CACIAM 22H1]